MLIFFELHEILIVRRVYVATVFPSPEHVFNPILRKPRFSSDCYGCCFVELVGEVAKKALRASLLHLAAVALCYRIAEEAHLAPKVITEAPTDKILFQLSELALRHIEHHRFQESNHVGTERKVFINPARTKRSRRGSQRRAPLNQPPSSFCIIKNLGIKELV